MELDDELGGGEGDSEGGEEEIMGGEDKRSKKSKGEVK